jgi:hypothetical protein
LDEISEIEERKRTYTSNFAREEGVFIDSSEMVPNNEALGTELAKKVHPLDTGSSDSDPERQLLTQQAIPDDEP